jgi:hypothetical protein
MFNALAAGQALVVGGFLLLAGTLKVLDLASGRHNAATVLHQWLGPNRETIASAGLSAAEVALGTLLLLSVRSTFASIAAGVLLTAAVLTLLVARNRMSTASCGCLGTRSDKPIGLTTILRAGVLALLAFGPAAFGAGSWTNAFDSLPAVAVMLLEVVLLARLSPELPRPHERAEWTRSRRLRRAVRIVRRTEDYRRHRQRLRSRRPADAWSDAQRDIVLFELAEKTDFGESWLAFAVERATGSVVETSELSLTPTVQGWKASNRVVETPALGVSASPAAS